MLTVVTQGVFGKVLVFCVALDNRTSATQRCYCIGRGSSNDICDVGNELFGVCELPIQSVFNSDPPTLGGFQVANRCEPGLTADRKCAVCL